MIKSAENYEVNLPFVIYAGCQQFIILFFFQSKIFAKRLSLEETHEACVCFTAHVDWSREKKNSCHPSRMPRS